MTCDNDTNKVTAIGEVDALKLKEKVERKMNRPVQLISPLPNKEKKQNENDSKGTNGDDKKTKAKEVMLPVAYSLPTFLHLSVYVVFVRLHTVSVFFFFCLLMHLFQFSLLW